MGLQPPSRTIIIEPMTEPMPMPEPERNAPEPQEAPSKPQRELIPA